MILHVFISTSLLVSSFPSVPFRSLPVGGRGEKRLRGRDVVVFISTYQMDVNVLEQVWWVGWIEYREREREREKYSSLPIYLPIYLA